MRIDVNFGGGTSDVFLYDGECGVRPYTYEECAEKMHEKFGGKQYYTSKSGLSGAGWFPSTAPVVKLGHYRPDICEPEEYSPGPIFDNVHVYCPIAGHDGLVDDAPVVITDRDLWIIYIDLNDVDWGYLREFISELKNEMMHREIKLTHIQIRGMETVFRSVFFYYPGRKKSRNKGIDCFLDFSKEISATEYILEVYVGYDMSVQTQLACQLGLKKLLTGPWVEVNRNGVIWSVFESDPRFDSNLEIRGWENEDDGLWWTRRDNCVLIMQDTPSCDKTKVVHLPAVEWVFLTREEKHKKIDAVECGDCYED